MWGKAMRLPYFLHGRDGEAHLLRHCLRRLMGRLMGRRHLGEAYHLRNRFRLNRGLAKGSSLVSEQAIEPFGHEPLLIIPSR